MAKMKELVRSAAHHLGYEVHRADLGADARRQRAMELRRVSVVLDVGANIGQYARLLRSGGYTGRIVSFEPFRDAFRSLHAKLSSDPGWQGRQCALGAVAGPATLIVPASDVLASLLPATSTLAANIPAARDTSEVVVEVVRLDDLWPGLISPGERVMLKIDTQGFEHSVLDGAADSLAHVELIEVEASLVPTYEGGSSIHDMLPRLRHLASR